MGEKLKICPNGYHSNGSPDCYCGEKGWEQELPQAILAALEYRGFHDCGKYLDETVFKHVSPIILKAVAKAVAKAKEEWEFNLENSAWAQSFGAMKFAEGAMKQREEDAKLCDELSTKLWREYKETYAEGIQGQSDGAEMCAAAIRNGVKMAQSQIESQLQALDK